MGTWADSFLPAITGELAQMGPGMVQGQFQGQNAARQLALLDAQIKQQQMQTQMLQRPQLESFAPGTTYGYRDPTSGQLTGMRTIPDPYKQSRVDIDTLRAQISQQQAQTAAERASQEAQNKEGLLAVREELARVKGAPPPITPFQKVFEKAQALGIEKLTQWERSILQAGTTGLAGAAGKPVATPKLPPSALKLQNDELNAIGAANTINYNLQKSLGQLEKGELQLGPMSNVMAAGKNWAGMSTEGSRNFASFKANLEKMRNDSLRLNNGVQTEGDAIRAWNELVANINDPKVVKQRMEEIMVLNNRAADLRRMQIDTIRQNFGVDPMDFSKFNQPSGGAPNQPNPITPPGMAKPSAQGWSIKKKG